MAQFMKLYRPDLANKSFDWMTADTEENYKQVIKTTKVPYGPGDFKYTYNNNGFRCDDFDNWKKFPYRILFAGCSMTEGIGLPLEDVWPKILHKKICEFYNIEMPFWTVASGGTGIDQLVRYIYNAKDFLRPHIIISYLPSKERRELSFETRWGHWSLDTPEGRNTRIFLEPDLIEYQTEKNIAMLDMILKDINCTFLFSSCQADFNIKDYIDSPRFVQRPHVPEQYDLARDGIHAGPATNKIMAERVFDDFRPKIEELLGLTTR